MEPRDDILYSLIVTARGNQESALGLLHSFDKQSTFGFSIEIVVVCEGPAESYLEDIYHWQAQTRHVTRIIKQEQSGTTFARNLAIPETLGKWVIFIDSHARLHSEYFNELKSFIERDTLGRASMICTRHLKYLRESKRVIDNDPMGWKFKHGARLVRLELEPHVLQLNIGSALFNGETLRQNGAHFIENDSCDFRDLDFIMRYLAQFDTPTLGLVPQAKVYYRVPNTKPRRDSDCWLIDKLYDGKGRFGPSELTKYVLNLRGNVPAWTQYANLYAISHSLLAERSWKAPWTNSPQSIRDGYWNDVHDVVNSLDPATIREFPHKNLGWFLTEGLLRRFKGESWNASKRVVVYELNNGMNDASSRNYVYSYYGAAPIETFWVDNNAVSSVYAKSIRHDLFGHRLMNERIVGLPSSENVAIELDGEPATIVRMPAANRIPDAVEVTSYGLELPGLHSGSMLTDSQFGTVSTAKRTNRVNRGLDSLRLKATEEAWITDKSLWTVEIRILLRLCHRWHGRQARRLVSLINRNFNRVLTSQRMKDRFRDAWICIDRPERADDNAEHFYRYVQCNHPEKNIWFLLKRNSPDWTRLQSEGFRLLAYGEIEAAGALVSARYLISSHLDDNVYEPMNVGRYGRITARRIFLQHGVTMNDISKWLNTKQLALVAAASPSELHSFTKDESRYRLTSQQVSYTGFPRHDSLTRLSKIRDLRARNRLLLVPTWRKSLFEDLSSATNDVQRLNIIRSSSFFKDWMSLVSNAEFLTIVKQNGLKPILILHDQLAAYSDLFNKEFLCETSSFMNLSVQDMLTSSKLVITDYSSLGLEAAIGGSRVFYYQPETENIYDGNHSFTKSWFNYELDGVGPVYSNIGDLTDGLKSLIAADWKLSDTYRARLQTVLPRLDGGASSRVFDAIESLDVVP